jgi:hypothetical protein
VALEVIVRNAILGRLITQRLWSNRPERRGNNRER